MESWWYILYLKDRMVWFLYRSIRASFRLEKCEQALIRRPFTVRQLIVIDTCVCYVPHLCKFGKYPRLLKSLTHFFIQISLRDALSEYLFLALIGLRCIHRSGSSFLHIKRKISATCVFFYNKPNIHILNLSIFACPGVEQNLFSCCRIVNFDQDTRSCHK